MKNINLIIIALLFCIAACTIQRNNSSNNEIAYKEGLVEKFKIMFFKNCVSSSAKDKAVTKFMNDDISAHPDFSLWLDDYDLIDSIVAEVVQEIEKDSIERTNLMCKDCDEETMQRMKIQGYVGKETIRICLECYTSGKLDSIARASVYK